jgi:acetyl esterase/lipase
VTSAGPEIDPEIAPLLAAMPAAPALDAETLHLVRPYATLPPETALAGHDVTRREVSASGADGAQVPLTVLRPAGAAPRGASAPCVYWVHGGGMVMGDRYSQIDIPLDWLTRFGAVVVSVDYRLAPEVGGTTLVEDCYAGLVWVAEHAAQLGIDPERIVVAGTSAGGGLAAGTTLLARDRGGPTVSAQVLVCPMLDHRNDTVSSRQHEGPTVWSRDANAFGWAAVLGGLDGPDGPDGPGTEVPASVSPALATDLSGLPTTYLDVGSAEVFRDEVVTYATRIWAAGGQAELHVWAGGVHGFDALFPEARVSRTARQARSDWLERVLVPVDPSWA